MFRINFYILVNSLLPRLLQRSKRQVWLYVLTSQVRKLYGQFDLLREKSVLELSMNGQVVYLEHYLNDVFDPLLRSILIENEAPLGRLYIGAYLENFPEYIGEASETPKAYVGAIQDYVRPIDFTVYVPSTLEEYMFYGTTFEVQAHVKRYMQAGKRFQIIIV